MSVEMRIDAFENVAAKKLLDSGACDHFTERDYLALAIVALDQAGLEPCDLEALDERMQAAHARHVERRAARFASLPEQGSI